MHTRAYGCYLALLKELQYEISQERGDGAVAEKLRDKMDPLWFQLSESEREEVNINIKLPYEFVAKVAKNGPVNDSLEHPLKDDRKARAKKKWFA